MQSGDPKPGARLADPTSWRAGEQSATPAHDVPIACMSHEQQLGDRWEATTHWNIVSESPLAQRCAARCPRLYIQQFPAKSGTRIWSSFFSLSCPRSNASQAEGSGVSKTEACTFLEDGTC